MQEDETFYTRTCVLGIDPGLNGGMALTKGNIILLRCVIPTFERFVSRSRRRYFDTFAFSKTIKDWRHLFNWAAVEAVHASPQMGVASAFSFGHVAGCIAGALASEGIHVVPVEPAVWKARMGLSSDKKLSLAKAKEIFGEAFKHDGIAEAALVGYYAQRRLYLSTEHPLS